jgi:tRNA (adenine37-N6)-methyltransferase
VEATPIGHILTPFPTKFGIPRQPHQVKKAKGEIILFDSFKRDGVFKEIESFNYLWLLFHFNQAKTWNPTVRPPRLGGNKRVGVFASRSPFRPNPIGLSVVKLIEVRAHSLLIEGIDVVNKTPLFDIKPYIPKWDIIEEAVNGWPETFPTKSDLLVRFSVEAQEELKNWPDYWGQLINDSLKGDPRPAYHEDPERVYEQALGPFLLYWKVADNIVQVLKIKTN